MKRFIRIKLIIEVILLLVITLPQASFAGKDNAKDETISRAMAVKQLYILDGEPIVSQNKLFDDKVDSLYSKAANWAYETKIVRGIGDKNFNGSRAITRDELITMLFRYAKYKHINTSVSEKNIISKYKDSSSLPRWSIPAFKWACEKGITTVTDGCLLPNKTVSRKEMFNIMDKFRRLDKIDAISLWKDESRTKQELNKFIKTITDVNSPDYIPIEDRIAVFDFDGTLFCETDPNYFDYTLLEYRVLGDPDYKNKASDFEREVANNIKEQNETGKNFSNLPMNHGKAVATAFAGMTIEEFNEYIQTFKCQTMPSYAGMLRGNGFYLPMVQIVEYLQANDFTVYIVSGTDRFIVRGILDGNLLNIPNRQIIGSDEKILASKQGDKDGLNYLFDAKDNLILGGEFIIKNLKMNKVTAIMREIGQKPVLSFGNSSGDSSMAEYVISNNHYRSLAFMLCCDDLIRENGNQSKADNMLTSCKKYGWIPVSMKNDWKTIYGSEVERTPKF